MKFDVSFCGRYVDDDGTVPTPEEIEAHTDNAVEELESLNASDIDVSLDLDLNMVRVVVTVDAEDALAAQEEGSALIRTAFHAAEVGTPGWSVAWTDARAQQQESTELAAV